MKHPESDGSGRGKAGDFEPGVSETAEDLSTQDGYGRQAERLKIAEETLRVQEEMRRAFQAEEEQRIDAHEARAKELEREKQRHYEVDERVVRDRVEESRWLTDLDATRRWS